MSIRLVFDERLWLPLPGSFPTDRGESAEQWEDRVVTGMREAWAGELTAEREVLVREALRHGLGRVQPEDSVTLQFWPGASLVNAVVHVVFREFAEGEQRQVVPLDPSPYPVEPASDLFETENLGVGVESRFLTRIDSTPPTDLGAVNYLFENDRGYVFVGVDPTLPRLVGALLSPLRAIVRGIEVVDDDGLGPWEPSAARAADLSTRGESWDVPDPAGTAPAGAGAADAASAGASAR